jgi:hypothetical protein
VGFHGGPIAGNNTEIHTVPQAAVRHDHMIPERSFLCVCDGRGRLQAPFLSACTGARIPEAAALTRVPTPPSRAAGALQQTLVMITLRVA